MELFQWNPTRLEAEIKLGLTWPRIRDVKPLADLVSEIDPQSKDRHTYAVKTPHGHISSYKKLIEVYQEDPNTKMLEPSSIQFRGKLHGEIETFASSHGGMILGMGGVLGGWALLGGISLYSQLHNIPHYSLSTALAGGVVIGNLGAYVGSKVFPPSLHLTLNPLFSDPRTLETFLERIDARKTLAKMRNKQLKK